MPANPSLIDAMARAMSRKDCELYGWTDKQHDIWWFKDPSNTSQDEYRDRARAALQALLEAGPTQAMLDRVCSDMPGASIAARDDVISDVFREMLRAALEEADNHG